MRKIMLTIVFAGVAFSTFAKVHKFSPEFQAAYDAATTPEVQEAIAAQRALLGKRNGGEFPLVFNAETKRFL